MSRPGFEPGTKGLKVPCSAVELAALGYFILGRLVPRSKYKPWPLFSTAMRIRRAYRTELDPNQVQRERFRQHAGVARWSYNWALAKKKSALDQGSAVPSSYTLQRELNQLKKSTHAWLYDTSKAVPQTALDDLDVAFRSFFRGRGQGRRVGFPHFKSRKRSADAFRVTGVIRVFGRHVQLPRLGKIRLKESEYLPMQGVHITAATVSERAGRWYVSLEVQQEIVVPINNGAAVGIDVGINRLATLSDGSVVPNLRPLERTQRRLASAQKALMRRRPGSQNRAKAQKRVARLHARASNLRRDQLHKLTTQVTKTKSLLVIEDLVPALMVRNRHLARALSDAAFGELRRQLEYKAHWYGSRILVADKFYPSTRMCSKCGALNDVPLSTRVFTCACGLTMDRDLNAALNLLAVAASSADTLNACGENVSPFAEWRSSEKQEPKLPRVALEDGRSSTGKTPLSAQVPLR